MNIIRNICIVLQKSIVSTLCVLFFLIFGCGNSITSSENGNEEPIVLPWVVKLKLKPQADENYLPTEDPAIKALLSKHGVTMTQTWPDPQASRELLLDYDLRGSGAMSEESKANCIADFLATGKFEDEVFEYETSCTS